MECVILQRLIEGHHFTFINVQEIASFELPYLCYAMIEKWNHMLFKHYVEFCIEVFRILLNWKKCAAKLHGLYVQLFSFFFFRNFVLICEGIIVWYWSTEDTDERNVQLNSMVMDRDSAPVFEVIIVI